MTAVKQAACSKAAVQWHQTSCRPDELWTTVWCMWWRQTSGDGDWPQGADLHVSERYDSAHPRRYSNDGNDSDSVTSASKLSQYMPLPICGNFSVYIEKSDHAVVGWQRTPRLYSVLHVSFSSVARVLHNIRPRGIMGSLGGTIVSTREEYEDSEGSILHWCFWKFWSRLIRLVPDRVTERLFVYLMHLFISYR